jgi:hypothetical protein
MPDVNPLIQPRYHQRPTKKITSTGIAWAAGSLAMFVCAVGFWAAWDAQASADDKIVDAQLRFLAERGDIVRDLTGRISAAYEQGARDAMRGLSDRQGLELTQACLAYRLRDVPTRIATPKKGV